MLLKRPRGLGARDRQHRALAPGHARRPSASRPCMDGRDDRGRRGRDRLHAPQLREDGRVADLLADHPLHRPAQLLLVLHERPRLGAGGGEAPGRPGAAARRGDPRDPVRVLADHGPLRLHRRPTWSTSGAITPFFVVFRAREDIYDLLESCCGARLTVSYVRIGGLAQDVPEDFEARCRKTLAIVRENVGDQWTSSSPGTRSS